MREVNCGIGTRFKRIGIPDKYVEEIGDSTEMRTGVGLTAQHVVDAVTRLLG